MAITGRLVDDKATTTGATSYASDVPAAGSETETHICWVINSHATDATLPTLSGGGLTWTQIDTAVFGGHRCTAFRARGTNTAAAVTASMGGVTQTGCIIIWGAWAGVDGTTNEGVVQFKANALGGDNPGFATLDNAVGVGNAVASGACSGNGADHTAEAPFAELSDVTYATPTTRGHMMWAVTTDTTPAHTAGASTFWRIVAVELKSAAQTISPELLDHTTTLFAPVAKLAASMGLIDHLLTVFAPALALRVEPPLIDHSMVVFSPASVADSGGGAGGSGNDKHFVRMRRRGMRSLQKGGM